MHHIVAFPLLYVIMMEKNATSVLTLLPFLTHSVYWINPYLSIDFEILGLYNASFLMCALICMHVSIMSGGKRSSLSLPVLCLIEVAVNYYAYCTDYDGTYCERGVLSDDLFFGSKLMAALLTGSVLLGSVTVCLIAKARLENTGSMTKLSRQDSDNSADEGISMKREKVPASKKGKSKKGKKKFV